MIAQITLVEGPSREQLFDCLRLGQTVPELQMLKFWGEHFPIEIEIEGLHRASIDGTDWFLWGRRRKHVSSRDTQVSSKEFEHLNFAFGRWNVHRRTGRIRLEAKSFFINPWKDEEGYYTEHLVVGVKETAPQSDALCVSLEGGLSFIVKKSVLSQAGLENLSPGTRVKIRGTGGNSITDLWGNTVAEILPA